jgi:hypothetical protein
MLDLSRLWAKPRRTTQLIDRFTPIAQLMKSSSEIEARFKMVGTQPDCSAEWIDGLHEPATRPHHHSQPEDRFVEARGEANRLTELTDGSSQIPAPPKRIGQRTAGLGVARLGRDQPSKVLDRRAIVTVALPLQPFLVKWPAPGDDDQAGTEGNCYLLQLPTSSFEPPLG